MSVLKNIAISVIIPTYKPKDYLWQCLDSIYSQTFPHDKFELIIVLNGCKYPYDESINLYFKEKGNDLKVKYIQTDIAGVSHARNLALDVAEGDYITFVDDDDFVSKDYLKELYLKVDPLTISLCYPFAFNDGEENIQLPFVMTDAYNSCLALEKNILLSKARVFFSGPCMKLIPIGCIRKRRFDIRFQNGEDSLFMFLISDEFKNIRFASSNAVYYRRVRMNSAVTRKRTMKEVVINSLKLIGAYSSIYFSNVFKYSFKFYLTRVLGALHVVYIYALKR